MISFPASSRSRVFTVGVALISFDDDTVDETREDATLATAEPVVVDLVVTDDEMVGMVALAAAQVDAPVGRGSYLQTIDQPKGNGFSALPGLKFQYAVVFVVGSGRIDQYSSAGGSGEGDPGRGRA